MENLTGFGMRNTLILPSLAIKHFNKIRDENDEPIYTSTHPFMRHFVRQSIKGGRCIALNQFYKSTISDELLIIMSQEVSVNGNICEILDKYFEYTNKHRKILENENDSQFIDYRKNDQEGRTKNINNTLSN